MALFVKQNPLSQAQGLSIFYKIRPLSQKVFKLFKTGVSPREQEVIIAEPEE